MLNSRGSYYNSPLSSILVPAAQFQSASQLKPQLRPLLPIPLVLPTRPHQQSTSQHTQLLSLVSQRPIVQLHHAMITKATNDTMAIAGHQLTAHTVSVMPTVQAGAQRPSALNQPSAPHTRKPSTKRLPMVAALLPHASQSTVHAKT